ncbi:hypothetical protein [Pedobacter africanus]|uniref:Uncharacterized protein n=1 Tax=Pedobacter africanus TaxID=151894 RepID=A0A1W2E8D1_9SPHI|nr:hypothetical protein [Pedobacter africanus]SMD05797.1 hypothetical protein SAMN04488524_4521 [Pedobacter africanus]
MEDNLENNGFSVPENYFNTLNDAIDARIRAEKIRMLAATEGYTVPEGYFEKLQLQILDKTVKEKKPQAKVLRLWRSSLLKYASAACFLIVSAAGLYFYQDQQSSKNIAHNDLATELLLYDIDEQVIIDHIEDHGLKARDPKHSNVELENYILNNYSQNDIASAF